MGFSIINFYKNIFLQEFLQEYNRYLSEFSVQLHEHMDKIYYNFNWDVILILTKIYILI